MSFDLHLQCFRNRAPAPADRARVAEVLAKQKHTGPDSYGFYLLQFPDGHEIEYSASGLTASEDFESCAFHIRGIDPELVRFIYDIARAGDFVIFNCQGDDSPESPVLILIRPDQDSQIPTDLATEYSVRPVCDSAESLGDLLFSDYIEWTNYRNQIVRDN